MLELGVVEPGSTLNIPFATYDSNDPSASVTATGLATSDIEIYKDGSLTQRASDAGYAVDTDFDALTGLHTIQIDLADNTTAGFFAAGSEYLVAVSDITVDAGTIRFWAARFKIGIPGMLHGTTIAAYTSTDNFTLNTGSTNDDAYNGCILIAYDVATQYQMQVGVVEDYTGSTKTVNLKADPGVFTMTANDHIIIMPPALLPTTAGNTLDVTATGEAGIDLDNTSGTLAAAQIASSAITADKIATDAITAAKIAANAITSSEIAADAIGASQIAADAIGSSELAASAVTEIQSGLATSAEISALNDVSAADVNAQCDAAIETYGLDHLVSASVTGTDVANNSIMARIVSASATADWDDFVQTTDSLQALRDHIGDGTNLTEAGGDGDHLTVLATAASISALNDVSAADVNAQCDTAISDAALATAASIAALNDISAADVNAQVLDVLNVDTFSEPGQGAPPASPTMREMFHYVYKSWRNRKVQDATTWELYDNAGTTVDQKATVSDDGTDFEKGEIASGP